ncbi:MAG: hypothetical protein A2020_02355 [Lentisphaerae bacterium GWF2_45_14]|nr:MAG: hypothetical protein A2020_02355 [Lentisphaerae bacterium GWF2_45_14]
MSPLTFKKKLYIGGCGCLLFIVLVISVFIFGAKYGRGIVERASARATNVYSSVSGAVKETGSDVKNTFTKTGEAAEDIAESVTESTAPTESAPPETPVEAPEEEN